MIFTATEQQVKEIALNAIKASKVVGMGVYQDRHFKGVPITLDDIDLDEDGLYIDYFRGRMVKLGVTRQGENTWKIRDNVNIEYQSWGETYPTVEELVNSVIECKKLMKIVFISPEFDNSIAISGEYIRLVDSLKDFMEHKKLEGMDLRGFFNWLVYVKDDSRPSLVFHGNIGEVFGW